MTTPLDAATELAEDLLFPTALVTDTSDRVPGSHLDALAAAGMYGLFGPADAGGLAVDRPTGLQIIEILAGACLTTTFVWMQHRSTVAAVAASATPGLRDRWLEPMCRGKWRAGIAVAGIRPGAGAMSTRAVDGGWLVNGLVPWVTGWGLIDVVHTAAIGPGGDVVWALVDAVESPSLAWRRQPLAAVHASVTGTLEFRDHFVPAERVTMTEPYGAWLDHDARGLRTNGSLALGVAGRCCRLLRAGTVTGLPGRPGTDTGLPGRPGTVTGLPGRAGTVTGLPGRPGPDTGLPGRPGPLDRELIACRAGLDHADTSDPSALAMARAAAARLCHQAAGALVVATGSRSVLMDQHPQRLAREAAFLLVFASRPAIQKELSRLLAGRC